MRERRAHRRLPLCRGSQGRAESEKLVPVRCFEPWAWIDPCTREYLPTLEAIFEEGSGSGGQPRVGLPLEALHSSWMNLVWDLDLQDSLKSKIRTAEILIFWRASHLSSATLESSRAC